MPGEIVVGLDVGTSKACAVVAEAGPAGALEIIGFGVAPCAGLRKGVVVDLSAAARSIQQCVAEASRQAQVEIRSVTVGVTGEHIASMNTHGSVAVARPGGEITESDRLRALDEARTVLCPPDRQILHAEPRRYAVDGQQGIRCPVGMSGSRLEVDAHVITAGRAFIDNLLRAVERNGLSVAENGLILASLASAESVISADEKTLGVALLDIGAGTSDLAVYDDGGIRHSAVVPVGAWHVTNDLVLGLQVAEEEAERLKREFGADSATGVGEEEIVAIRRPGSGDAIPVPRRILTEIIEPRIEELFELIAASLAAAQVSRPPAGMVLTGGGAQLAGIVPVAERVIEGLPIRLGLPRCAGGIADRVAKPPFATAVGLAMVAGSRQVPADGFSADGHLMSPIQRWLRRVGKSGARRPSAG